jgi:hypothetical protein
MKLMTIQFPDTVDMTVIPKGTVVTVGDGTSSLQGKVFAQTDLVDEPVPPHIHAAITDSHSSTSIGPPIV